MPKDQEPIAPNVGAAAPSSKIRFEDCDYTAQETQRILAAGTTTFFEKILPELESYLEGNRRKITGRSILAYRARKLAEPRQMSAAGSQGSEQLRKSRSEKRRSRKRAPGVAAGAGRSVRRQNESPATDFGTGRGALDSKTKGGNRWVTSRDVQVAVWFTKIKNDPGNQNSMRWSIAAGAGAERPPARPNPWSK